MADETEEERKAREDKARQDADAGTKLDKVLGALDAMCGRMDAMEGRMDADEKARKDAAAMMDRKDADETEEEKKAREDKAKKDSARKDGEGEEDEGKGKPAETAADKAKKDKAAKDAARKDGEDGAEAEAEAARKDAALAKAELQELREQMAAQSRDLADLKRVQPRARTDADYHSMAEAQSRYDSVTQALGLGPAPIPFTSETLTDYKLRVNTKLKPFSPRWKDVNLHEIASSEQALALCDRQIFEDAREAAMRPQDLKPGELRPVVTTDDAGRKITSFVGPNSFVLGMKARSRRVGRIRNSTAQH